MTLPGALPGGVPRIQQRDGHALARAARTFAPMLRRRGWFMLGERGKRAERQVRKEIDELLEAIEADDLVKDDASLLWARVESSGLVLVGVGRRAVIVGRVKAPRGGLAARLLVR